MRCHKPLSFWMVTFRPSRHPLVFDRLPGFAGTSLLRLLPAGAVAGWGLHPLESAAFARRTPNADSRKRRLGSETRCFLDGAKRPQMRYTDITLGDRSGRGEPDDGEEAFGSLARSHFAAAEALKSSPLRPQRFLSRRQRVRSAGWRRTDAGFDEIGQAVWAWCRAFQRPRRCAGMMKIAPEEQHFFLSSLSSGRAQRRLALAVVLVLLLALVLFAGPLSSTEARRIDAFVPAYAMAMFVTNSITAVLLFAQFSILRSPALLAIAMWISLHGAHLFSVDAYLSGHSSRPAGMLGAGLQQSTHLVLYYVARRISDVRHRLFPA